MALTDTQKAQVRYYLGYSDLSAGGWSALEGAMLAVSAEGEVLIEETLAKLAALELKITSFSGASNVKRVEEIEFFPGWEGIGSLYMEGNRLVRMLAAILGVAVLCYPFGGGSVGVAGRG